MEPIFCRTDILLPRDCDLRAWSVVACDQFTSDPGYWDRLDALVGEAPSSLRLILPEARLAGADLDRTAADIAGRMEQYLRAGVFRALPDSYVYLERTLPDGRVRRGLVGALDLEAYDYRPDARTPVRATEGTVESRLPARMRIRAAAPLELPHTMVFFNDPADRALGDLAERTGTLEPLYDFTLNAGGGRARGWRVTGPDADRVDAALDALDGTGLRYAMGDGNHSLATAKACWEQTKRTLSPEQWAAHPARRSLVELVNIHDPAIVFEPIHRCLRCADPAAFLREAEEFFADRYRPGIDGLALRLATAAGETERRLDCASVAELIAAVDELISAFLARHGGEVDYIHNDETALDLARQGWCALLLPKLDKGELFPTVERRGPYPRKSFSIGRAEEKRYYLEARKII